MMVLLIGALVLLLAPRIMRRRGGGVGGELAQGTLLVTGVSPRPDATGEQFVTITGVINGPTVNEHVVYQQLAVDVERVAVDGAADPGGVLAEEPGQWAFAPDGACPPAVTADAGNRQLHGRTAWQLPVADAQQFGDAGQLDPRPAQRSPVARSCASISCQWSSVTSLGWRASSHVDQFLGMIVADIGESAPAEVGEQRCRRCPRSPSCCCR